MPVNLGSAYGEISIGTGGAERSVATLANSMRRVGGAMSVAITAPLLLIGKAALSATGDFEQALNTMQVVSGATSEQMDALSATALQLGKDTSFSAGEAAAGMLELAKAGMSAEQVTAAIAGTMDLAAAGGLSVAQAAEISANALNAFKLPASDAGRVADVLAAAANASSIEVTDMAMSFQMASAVFASNGQSIEDLATATALLGNNGIKASDAGTSLKAMLIRLTAPVDAAAGVMADLGIEVYNADGSMRSFEDIVYSLQTATAGLTDEQRNQALTTIFGADAIRAANILINEGADSWQDMETAVSEAGAAQLVADAKMKGLSGSIRYAAGTIQSTLINAFLPFTDMLSSLVRRVADIIGSFADLPASVQKAVLVFLAIMAAIGPILLALPMLAGLLAALLSPIGLIGIAVAALAAAWVADWGGIQGKTKEVIDYILYTWDQFAIGFSQGGDILQSVLYGFYEVLDDFLTENQLDQLYAFGDTVQKVAYKIYDWFMTKIPAALNYLKNLWETYWPIISGAVSNAVGIAVAWFGVIWQWLTTNIPVAIAWLQSAWAAVWAAMPGFVTNAVQTITGLFSRLKTWLTQTIPDAFNRLVRDVQIFIEVVKGLFEGDPFAVEVASQKFGDFGYALVQLVAKFQETKAKITAVWAALVAFFTPTINRIKSGFQEMISKFAEMGPQFSALWAAAKPVLDGLVKLIGYVMVGVVYILGNAFAAVMPAIAEIVGGLLTSLTAVFTGIQEIWAGTVAFFIALINGDWAGAWEAAQGIGRAFLKMMTGIFTGLWQIGKSILTALVTFIVGILTDMGVDVDAVMVTLKGVWDVAWTAIKDFTKTAVDAIIKLWETVKTWLVETLPANLESLRASFVDLWPKIKEAAVNALNLILAPIKDVYEYLNTKISTAAGILKTFLQTFSLPNPFELIQGALSSVGGMIDGLSGKLQAVKNFLSSFSLPNPFSGWSMPEMPSWMSGLPGFATGTNFAPGGMAIVGERGPELVNLPRGSKVHTANSPETQNALNGTGGAGQTINYYLTANYGYQSPGNLADDITLLQMMAGA